jgi:hypothetical protein
MGPIDCPKTLVTNYQPTPRHIPEEQRAQKGDIQGFHGIDIKDSGLLGGYAEQQRY